MVHRQAHLPAAPCCQQEVDAILRDQARGTVARAALTLRALRACSEAMAAHVRSAVWAAERRWAQLEVPLSLIHPSLDAPLRPCRAPVAAAMYDDVPTQVGPRQGAVGGGVAARPER